MFRFKNVGEIPHGVVEQSIGTIPLTKKERDEIAKEERRRMNQKLEAQNERYQIIRSTQRIIPIEDKSFYERRKALEKKKREEEEKAAENTVIDVEM